MVLALQAAVASLLVAISTFGQIVAYFIFVTVAFVALTVAGLFVLRRRLDTELYYRTPGYPATPIVFVVLMVLLLFIMAASNPRQALIGIAVVALGALIYPWVARKSQPGNLEQPTKAPVASPEAEQSGI